MKFTPLEIPDIILIEPKVFEDTRGFFFESYHQKLFQDHGIPEHFVQDNHSRSSRGVLRGLHYQVAPRAQAKCVRVIRGEVFDVVVDIRRGSRTYGQYVSIHLSEKNKRMVYIPAGFAHGFCVLEDGTEFLYKVSDFYSPADERGVIWNDPDLAIAWPQTGCPYIISPKDQKYPRLKDLA